MSSLTKPRHHQYIEDFTTHDWRNAFPLEALHQGLGIGSIVVLHMVSRRIITAFDVSTDARMLPSELLLISECDALRSDPVVENATNVQLHTLAAKELLRLL